MGTQDGGVHRAERHSLYPLGDDRHHRPQQVESVQMQSEEAGANHQEQGENVGWNPPPGPVADVVSIRAADESGKVQSALPPRGGCDISSDGAQKLQLSPASQAPETQEQDVQSSLWASTLQSLPGEQDASPSGGCAQPSCWSEHRYN